jgi:hypothetical protein
MRSSTTRILGTFRKLYTHAYNNHPDSHGAKLYQACNDAVYLNGQPLNVLKACMILNDAKMFNEVGSITKSDYEALVSDIASITAYTKKELLERVA